MSRAWQAGGTRPSWWMDPAKQAVKLLLFCRFKSPVDSPTRSLSLLGSCRQQRQTRWQTRPKIKIISQRDICFFYDCITLFPRTGSNWLKTSSENPCRRFVSHIKKKTKMIRIIIINLKLFNYLLLKGPVRGW